MNSIEEFFATARERHAIYLRRKEGLPKPWTQDPIFQQHRFCNCFRELDTTTIWFKDHVREPMRHVPEVMLATVVFRLFNRIETGEAIFCQFDLDGNTAWQNFMGRQNTIYPDEVGTTRALRRSILHFCGDGPYCTGSYIVNSPGGMDKLTGVLWMIEQFATSHTNGLWKLFAENMLYENTRERKLGTFGFLAPLKQEGGPWRQWRTGEFWTLEEAWHWFQGFPGIGPFVAYELVSDLRHTDLLCNAPDIMHWANPGPGAKRGLDMVFGKEEVKIFGRLNEMEVLLCASQDPKYWPTDYPPWEMREVEHWLCEYAKIKRIQAGGPGTRRRFNG